MLPYKKSTKFSQVMEEYPGIAEYLARKYPKMKVLKNPIVVQMMAPRITLAKMAKKHDLTFEELIKAIEIGVKNNEIGNGEKHKIEIEKTNDVKEKIKNLMKALFEEGENVEEIREKFKEIVSAANPIIIAIAEAELTKEGYSIQDLMKACDVHLELFKDELMNSRRKVSKSHPLWRFIKDHDAIMFWFEEGLRISREMSKRNDYKHSEDLIEKLKTIMKHLRESENHDVRQENTLFPVLEKYGVEEPPAIMWDEHSRMKEKRRKIEEMINKIPSISYEEFVNYVQGAFTYLVEIFVKHTQKEQEILYNVALDVLSEHDWKEIERESNRFGYFELPKEVLKDE